MRSKRPDLNKRLEEIFRKNFPEVFNGDEDSYDSVRFHTFLTYPYSREKCEICKGFPEDEQCVQATAYYSDDKIGKLRVFAHTKCLEQESGG